MKQIELLAPAKNLEYGITAINCGADAVYIGANKFGARTNVGNTPEDIEKLINHAHKFNTKVYITLNTLLYDNEIPEAKKLIKQLYNMGTDAIIVQDMGLLELDLPPIPLFASTQTHNNNWQKVEFLEKAGFQRIILARELSLEQIKEIKSRTSVELESFVHGALCVCYSGQCYLSYAIGKRSGNKGECAQPCRKLYSLKDESGKIIAKDKHLLSLKDLNLSNYLKDLLEAGVTSFKIEGRLKDINYIKNIVSFYRQELDKILEENEYTRASSGKIITDFIPNPDKTFNRSYTDYFLNGRSKKITSFDTPKFTGEPLGKVLSVEKNYFTLNCKSNLNNGDGISFFDEKGVLQGTVINKIEGNKIFPNKIELIKKNLLIYRNYDHEFNKTLEKAKVERKIGISIKFYSQQNSLILEIIDEDGIKIEKAIDNKFDTAEKAEKALENIEKQLSKLGETEFYLNDISVNLNKIPFIPVKELNELRRSAVEELGEARIKNYQRNKFKLEKNNFPYPQDKLEFSGNVLNKLAWDFYIRHGVKEIEAAAESGINLQGRKVMTTKHCLKYQFDLCPKTSKDKFDKKLYLVDEFNKEYLLEFNCKDCEMSIKF